MRSADRLVFGMKPSAGLAAIRSLNSRSSCVEIKMIAGALGAPVPES